LRLFFVVLKPVLEPVEEYLIDNKIQFIRISHEKRNYQIHFFSSKPKFSKDSTCFDPDRTDHACPWRGSASWRWWAQVVILLYAILLGLVTGLITARINQARYMAPVFHHVWLVVTAFLPQYMAIYFPVRDAVSQSLFASVLVISQVLFLGFAFLNRNLSGMKILAFGALLNLLVITANHGFMPISQQTARQLVSEQVSLELLPGDRFGPKDMVLPPEQTRFEWLADRFLTPPWFPHQSAFSLGDVFIAAGAFWLLAKQENKKVITHDRSNYVSALRES
jgi:hypothetical protein